MGKTLKQKPVKLIIGFIFKEEPALNKAKVILTRRFGRIDFESTGFPFTYTSYYEGEFGTGLKRKFISFKKLIPPSTLAKIKTAANRIEKALSKAKKRRVNIDPGYLDLSKLVLASTKDYKHRIYLDRDIYAEVTLFYQDKTFKPWEWTYPDYKSGEYIAIFNQIRQIYAEQIKGK